MKKLRTAVIGIGSMGINHTRIYDQISDLVAISDINEKQGKLEANKYHAHFYKNYMDMLEKEKIDAVSVVVPTSYHKKVVLDCLKFNIPTLVEKPLSVNIRDSKKIIQTAKNEKTLLMVGHIERFNPAVIKLKNLIENKVLGKIISVVIKRVGLYPPRINDVDVITDLAVHDLDIACSLIGHFPNHIYATGGYGLANPRMDYADIFLDFNKVSCCIQVNWMTPIKIRKLSITGTLGYAELDYISQELAIYRTNPDDYNRPFKTFIKIKQKEPLKIELEHFLESIIKKQKPDVMGEDGLRAVYLAEMASKSINKNKLISLDGFKK